MRCTLLLGSIASAIAAIAPVAPAAAQNDGPGAARAGWYIGAGMGANWRSTIGQQGWNKDTLCYPDSACFDQNPVPSVSGYRWRYDIDLDTGAAFEISAGRFFGRARLELSFSQHRNDASQVFAGISYYDGSPILPRPGSTVVSSSQTYIDSFTARSAVLSLYYDFPGARGGISPYIGAGLGVSSVEMSDAHFSSDYRDTAGEPYDPPLSFYNSRQTSNLRDTRLTWRLYAGADYAINDGLLLGLKLSYAATGNFEDVGVYESHPFHEQDPNLTHTNRFSGPRGVTLAITVKRLLGR